MPSGRLTPPDATCAWSCPCENRHRRGRHGEDWHEHEQGHEHEQPGAELPELEQLEHPEQVEGGWVLPAGWEEVVSRSTGDVYYYCAATGESTYDWPGTADDAQLGEGAQEGFEMETMDDQHGEHGYPDQESDGLGEEGEGALPEGWGEQFSSTTGQMCSPLPHLARCGSGTQHGCDAGILSTR